ncbi:MAG TPA: Hsp70 family protein [Vicinamibacterales bacterium]|nr:Hsp70 family protein [Vicinamibacterales bacterium]
MAAPLVIGIDLGTTNCAVACADAGHAEDRAPVHVVPVMQLVEPAETDRRPLLPSFLYIPSEVDFPAGSVRLPWDGQPGLVIGELARRRGAENPSRLVASAKSWLSSGGANRTAPILPWGAPAEIPHLSPVEASAACLRHIAAAFDHDQPGSAGGRRLVEQDVLVTVPASFDEEARELTLQAARAAGFGQVTLLEEPQAAFYAWIDALGERWRRRVSVGDLILVCDVGGGTTDFSLIAVGARDGELALERVAVGDHILLGGDNMDLALARLMQQRLEAAGHRIDTWQLHGLWHQCRAAKETLLSDDDLQEHPVTVLGRGTRLIGGTLTTTLTRDDLDRVLLDGFFPVVSSADMPARARRVGLQELGLPYAADAAVTKHLARFLSRQGGGADATAIRRGAGGLACPTHVLFNGGVMKAPAVRARIVNVLDGWLRDEGLEGVVVLEAADLDHAVARGAAYYGLARRGRGVRIRSGAARSYYVGIESAMPAVPGLPAPLKALCVVPFGMEEGTSVSMPGPELGLIVGEPAEFRFLSSSVRRQDPAGALIEDWGDDLEELSPLEVTLERPGAADLTVPVTLESHVNEVGTLELWCVARDGSGERWKLELNIRERDPD